MSAKQSQRTTANALPQKTTPFESREHNGFIKTIVEEFAKHFAPSSELIYVRNTHGKPIHLDEGRLVQLGVNIDAREQMPDVMLIDSRRNRLFLVEANTGNGPVDTNRREELERLFANATQYLIYITAFPNRALMACHVLDIAWETEVWVADAPSHLIHFNGSRFLGPYADA